MAVRIHCGHSTLWLAGEGDSTIDPVMSRPSTQVYRHPSDEQMKAALQALWLGQESDFVLQDLSSEYLLRSICSRVHCIDAAGGLVSDATGRYLMIYRRGYWDLPKGKLDDGESLEECALREVQEETGLSTLRSEGALLTTYHLYRQDGMDCLKCSHWYRMHFFGSEPPVPQTEEDIERIEWLTRQEVLERLPLAYPSIREVMEASGVN
jgi:8-oxo-dGTP pyrophosphatase MutT (NUDIX family)